MKKYIAVFTVILVLIGTFGCPLVLAETTSTTAEDADTTTTVATDDGVGETTADTTATTEVTEGVTTTTVTEDTDTTTTAAEDDTDTAIKTVLIVLEKDGKIAARVTTASRIPVAGIRVALQIGTTKMPGTLTNEEGYAEFNYAFPQDDTYIYCYTEPTMIGNTLYAGAAAGVGKQFAADTTVSDTTETTVDSGSTTTAGSTTYRTYHTTGTVPTEAVETLTRYTATGTTGMEETHITLDFSFDSGILDVFKAEEKDFAKIAKLLLTPECYTRMLGGVNGVLAMSAATSETAVTDEQITAAVADDAVLSLIDPSKVERIVMDLSMQLLDTATGEFTDVWNIAEGDYVIQLPIPHSMRSAQTIAVAAVTADGVSTPVYAHISKDGFIRFESTSPAGTIVILGFKGSMLGALTGHAVRSSIIFLCIGIACIGGAIFLYFRFVRRPKKAKKSASAETVQSAPADEQELPPLDNEYEQLGIFEDAADDAPAPLRSKGDPDIDIPL